MSKKCMNCGKFNDDIASYCSTCKGTEFRKFELKNFESDGKINLEEIEELSNKGSINALYFLGKIYLFGLYNVRQNIEKAEQIFTDLQKIEYKDSHKYLHICYTNSYNIEKLLLENNKRTYPVLICKNCESIIPIYKLKSNSHRTVQIYGTSFFETWATQSFFDTFFSSKHLACPSCYQEELLTLGTPLAESLIKKHYDNKDYQNILLSEYEFDMPVIKTYKKEKNSLEEEKKTEYLFYIFFVVFIVVGLLIVSYMIFKPA